MINTTQKIYDVAIIGGGPAGLTAALYAIRDDKKVVLFEKNIEGGQILNTNSVVNIPGFAQISGADFIDKMLEQITSLPGSGALMDTVYEDVQDIVDEEGNFTIHTNGEQPYFSKTIICATGSTYRTLGVTGEKELIGKGISFCSTCDAPFYRNKNVIVVGGGNSALTEALELSKFAQTVKIYQNLPSFTASQDLINRVENDVKITYQFNTTIVGFDKGDASQIKYWISCDNSQQITTTDGVFVAIGLAPNNEYAKHIASIDEQGYISTLVDGAFAAGDCKKITANQVVVACGSGAKAAIKACRYLNSK